MLPIIISHYKHKQQTQEDCSFYFFYLPQQTDTSNKGAEEKSVPISEDVSQREGQGGVLSHLQDRTPALTRSHGGIAAV